MIQSECYLVVVHDLKSQKDHMCISFLMIFMSLDIYIVTFKAIVLTLP